MDVFEAIKTRRSVREFTDDPVTDEELEMILEGGRWAPSGLNNQPWRFMKITNPELIKRISEFTKYRGVVAQAKALICVFLDANAVYDRTKDVQSVGAAIENMLLVAHNLGLGATWLGEILNRREEVEDFLKVPDDYELMAVIAIGRPVPRERVGVRHPLSELLVPEPEFPITGGKNE